MNLRGRVRNGKPSHVPAMHGVAKHTAESPILRSSLVWRAMAGYGVSMLVCVGLRMPSRGVVRNGNHTADSNESAADCF